MVKRGRKKRKLGEAEESRTDETKNKQNYKGTEEDKVFEL